MTQQEFESILIPGKKLEAFIIEDNEEIRNKIEECHKKQEKILRQKIIRREDMEQIITI